MRVYLSSLNELKYNVKILKKVFLITVVLNSSNPKYNQVISNIMLIF